MNKWSKTITKKQNQQPQQQKLVKNITLKIRMHIHWCFVCERKACNTQTLPVDSVVSKSPPHRLETSRGEAFAKPQSVTAMTRKEFDNLLAKQRKEVKLNIKFT